MTTSGRFHSLDVEDLRKVCYLAFYLGYTTATTLDWDSEDRTSMVDFLADIPEDFERNALKFLLAEKQIRPPRRHAERLAELPMDLRDSIVEQFNKKLPKREQVTFEDLLDDVEVSKLLYRWSVWDRRQRR